jgi:hypothetical protein
MNAVIDIMFCRAILFSAGIIIGFGCNASNPNILWQGSIEELQVNLIETKKEFTKIHERILDLKDRLDKLIEKPKIQDERIEQTPDPPTFLLKREASEEGFPQIEKIIGIVSIYDQENRVFVPASIGTSLSKPVLFTVPQGGELIVSFPGKIAARVGENSRIIIAPSENDRFEVNLQNGTISAFLDPKRDKEKGPVFAIRTKSGVTEATGTFYAVTEYKGQAYAAVKKGKVKKETVPPTKPDFSAYLKKSTFSTPKQGASSKK